MFEINPHNYNENKRMQKELRDIVKLFERNDDKITTGDINHSKADTYDHFISRQYLDELLARPNALDVNECSNMKIIDTSIISKQLNKIKGIMWNEYKTNSIHTTGNFLYPADRGYMGWHTNVGFPGFRIYMTYVKEGNNSGFLYYDKQTDSVINSVDQQGWTIRMFDTSDPSEPLWHAVWAREDRYSIGFTIKE